MNTAPRCGWMLLAAATNGRGAITLERADAALLKPGMRHEAAIHTLLLKRGYCITFSPCGRHLDNTEVNWVRGAPPIPGRYKFI